MAPTYYHDGNEELQTTGQHNQVYAVSKEREEGLESGLRGGKKKNRRRQSWRLFCLPTNGLRDPNNHTHTHTHTSRLEMTDRGDTNLKNNQN